MGSRPVLAFLSLAAVLGVSSDSRTAGAGPEAHVRPPEAPASASVTGPDPCAPILSADPGTPSPGRMFDRVVRRARELAAAHPAPAPPALPDARAGLSYDAYRAIRFRPQASLWRDSARFEVQLFHPGYRYRDPVCVHVVDSAGASRLPFERRRFEYGDGAPGAARGEAADLDYAGLRIHYPLDRERSKDEVAVFLGASYFRLRGAGQVHGLSGRGIAVNPGSSEGEEFPRFRGFWLLRPDPGDTRLTFFALLVGRSITGAYRFRLEPGERTTMAVDARVFARRDVEKLGVAPFSSMFLHDGNRGRSVDDFRPEVHDSDGLLMLTAAGEWIWRPLSNGPGLRVTSLRDEEPRGFGLAQRDRAFESYLDLEARYDRRPSLWASLGAGEWGRGGVELLEIPAESEFADNVAAYWVPDRPFRAGEERRFRYTLTTFGRRLPSQTLGQVERTRIGRDGLPGEADRPPPSRRRFVVDFAGGELAGIDRDEPVRAVLSTTAGELLDRNVQALPDGRGWRATFVLDPDGERPADMRLFLELRDRRLTETWSYLWEPARAG